MTHKHNAPDLDTSTGLPRKMVGKVAVWALASLQAIALACLIDIRKTGQQNAEDLGRLRVQVAKIEGLLKITAAADAPVVAVNGVETPEVQ